MGTKENPSRFDAISKAEPNEPYFTLLARDPIAPKLVRDWAAEMQRLQPGHPKVFEALEAASQMEAWHTDYMNRPQLPVTGEDFQE